MNRSSHDGTCIRWSDCVSFNRDGLYSRGSGKGAEKERQEEARLVIAVYENVGRLEITTRRGTFEAFYVPERCVDEIMKLRRRGQHVKALRFFARLRRCGWEIGKGWMRSSR